MFPLSCCTCPKRYSLASVTATFRRYSSSKSLLSNIFRVSQEVEEAVRSKRPVVALETTIYTHGFPYPDNVALASHLESVVRVNGGIPATIGVLNGTARVGLDPGELIELASAAGKIETMKISRRDLPYITGLGIAGKKINGGTTIAGTMVLAEMAGIEIFGTGGLGGVHRGGEITMDVSADLTELGRTPVTVISSGCKSFLDIPRTLEFLETHGVCVSTFADGRTGNIDLPAFWTRESGVKSPSVVQNEKEAAAIIYARRLLDLRSGLFFANPIPQEHSIPKLEIDSAIDEAVRDAERQGAFGHANTPFILARIKQLTGGKSIPANRALIESNVARATKVAVELSKIKSQSRQNDNSFMPHPSSSLNRPQVDALSSQERLLGSWGQTTLVQDSVKLKGDTEVDVLVAGSVAVDLSCDYSPLKSDSGPAPLNHTSNPALISQSIGGVGNNVATAVHLIGNKISVRLCSVVADDLAGNMILSSLRDRGLDTTAIRVLASVGRAPNRTAQYVAINDQNKDLVIAMADMGIIGSPEVDLSHWQSVLESSKAKWVVVDANWHEATVHGWAKAARETGAQVAFEPVSAAKSVKLFPPYSSGNVPGDTTTNIGVYPYHTVDLTSPNEHELDSMHSAAKSNNYFESQDWWTVIDAMGIPSTGVGLRMQGLTSRELVEKGIPQRMIQLLPYIPTIVTKLGAKGVILARLLPAEHPLLTSPTSAPYILSRSSEPSTPTSAPPVGGIYLRLFLPSTTLSPDEIISVNGVGDTFLGVLVAGLAKGLEPDERLVMLAQKAAVQTLRSAMAVGEGVAGLRDEMEELLVRR